MVRNAVTAPILAICLFLFAGPVLGQWIDIKDPSELRELHSDRSFIATTEDGKPWNTFVHKSDGHGTASAKGTDWTRDWVVKGDQVCINEHLGPSWEGNWLCRTVQRNATIPDQYRSISVDEPGAKTIIAIPKVLYYKVRPAPPYRKADGKAVG